MNEMTDQELKQLMEEYATISTELKPLVDKMNDMKKKMQGAVKDRGETLVHGGVEAKYRVGYSRTNWDGKALAGYAVAHPEIVEFRTVREVGPSVAIKVIG